MMHDAITRGSFLARSIPGSAAQSLLWSRSSTLRKGPCYVIGHPLEAAPDAPKAPGVHQLAWTNEYSSAVSAEDHKQERLEKNLTWMLERLGYSWEHTCIMHLLTGYPAMEAMEVEAVYATVNWHAHREALRIVQPSLIVTFGTAGVSPFWYMYEQSEELGDSWDRIRAGHGNWQCRSFTGTYLGRRIPVIGLPHLYRYKLEGKHHVVEWIQACLSQA